MRRRALLTLLIVPAAWPVRAVASWTLITQEEAVDDFTRMHPPPVHVPPVPGAPTIEIVEPSINAMRQRPFSMRARFVPGADASIVLASFKATYGWQRLDITARLLAHGTISADGLAVDDIYAPRGSMAVTLSIADTLGRVGTATFRFTIAGTTD